MRSDDYYRGKAEECDRKAAAAGDTKARDRWLKMAADWRALISDGDREPKPS